jgi:pimeloyl-ACP methyl ester carboxylesterase
MICGRQLATSGITRSAAQSSTNRRIKVNYVTSQDGTKIAFDRVGHGPPVIIVNGLLCDRSKTQKLAEYLAQSFTVFNFDRRGRGDSSDTDPYAVEREIEDIAALIKEVGGAALVYGHSSGAGLALNAAASGLAMTKLVLHEPPYGSDDEESQRSSRELALSVKAALSEGKRADAITLFMTASGLPDKVIEDIRTDPKMLAMAPTMVYDHEVMGDFERGGKIPLELVKAIRIPTLVLVGGASPDFFRDAAIQIAEILPQGNLIILEGQDHGASAEVVAPVVSAFFNAV